ncbi:MAG: WYL domain-containing protein [Bacteroidales bacterium]|nr:WYL domain-containing protein [Bacteroidales bacterium]
MKNEICKAIRNKKIIKFLYDGESRTVEPHCYGLTTKGNEAIRAYQIAGYSSSGKMGWKLYDLSKAGNIQVLDESFDIRNDYKKGDKGMSEIYCEL